MDVVAMMRDPMLDPDTVRTVKCDAHVAAAVMDHTMFGLPYPDPNSLPDAVGLVRVDMPGEPDPVPMFVCDGHAETGPDSPVVPGTFVPVDDLTVDIILSDGLDIEQATMRVPEFTATYGNPPQAPVVHVQMRDPYNPLSAALDDDDDPDTWDLSYDDPDPASRPPQHYHPGYADDSDDGWPYPDDVA